MLHWVSFTRHWVDSVRCTRGGILAWEKEPSSWQVFSTNRGSAKCVVNFHKPRKKHIGYEITSATSYLTSGLTSGLNLTSWLGDSCKRQFVHQYHPAHPPPAWECQPIGPHGTNQRQSMSSEFPSGTIWHCIDSIIVTWMWDLICVCGALNALWSLVKGMKYNKKTNSVTPQESPTICLLKVPVRTPRKAAADIFEDSCGFSRLIQWQPKAREDELLINFCSFQSLFYYIIVKYWSIFLLPGIGASLRKCILDSSVWRWSLTCHCHSLQLTCHSGGNYLRPEARINRHSCAH